MSNPGYLAPGELKSTIVGDQLAIAYVESFNNAAAELTVAFGFAPVVKSPYGGYRTAAEQKVISPGTSPSISDHTKGRGVDIDNQRSFRNVNEKLFVDILAKHGWRNVNTSGNPFPSEPWHFANHSGGSTPTVPTHGYNPFGLSEVRGLQKIANLYGAQTQLDNAFGTKSMRGFARFLRLNYGYVGNDVFGPVMRAAMARWLRARYSYVGNDVLGPVMRAALKRANDANYAAL